MAACGISWGNGLPIGQRPPKSDKTTGSPFYRRGQRKQMVSEGCKGPARPASTRKLITSASSDWGSRESWKARDVVGEPSLWPGLKDLTGQIVLNFCTILLYPKSVKTGGPPSIPDHTQTG